MQQSIQTPLPRNLRRDFPFTGAEGKNLPITSRLREVILPFSSAIMTPLGHKVPFWAHSYTRDMGILEKVGHRFMKMLHGQGICHTQRGGELTA